MRVKELCLFITHSQAYPNADFGLTTMFDGIEQINDSARGVRWPEGLQ
jgi:hypothetical protein